MSIRVGPEVVYCQRDFGPGPDGHCDACNTPGFLACPGDPLFQGAPDVRLS
jgi:hypothetical protein